VKLLPLQRETVQLIEMRSLAYLLKDLNYFYDTTSILTAPS